MKIYANLPTEVKRNGKIYVYLGGCSSSHQKPNCKHIVVSVLSRNLRGRTDLYGNPYKPTQFYFIEK